MHKKVLFSNALLQSDLSIILSVSVLDYAAAIKIFL